MVPTRRLLALCATILTAAFLGGCAHPAPRAIVVPSAVPVRAAIAVAKATNVRAEKLAAKAEQVGIAAGSADAQALVLATTTTDSDLAKALSQVDQLTAILGTVQKEADTQTTQLAAMTTKYNAAVKTLWWYRERFWGPLVFALLAVGVFLVARFTAWGTRTLGPYLVDAGQLAAKAAVLA